MFYLLISFSNIINQGSNYITKHTLERIERKLSDIKKSLTPFIYARDFFF